MSEVLDAIEIETGKAPAASIIWLHGLGADGNDFATIVPEIDLPKEAIRFVFPHAPMQPVTINGGMRMRAWYDIADGANRREDERGVRASQALVETLIGREKKRGTNADGGKLKKCSRRRRWRAKRSRRQHYYSSGRSSRRRCGLFSPGPRRRGGSASSSSSA